VIINFNFKEVVQSKMFKGFIIGLATFLVLVIVFQAGVFVGFKKAGFSQMLGENYGRIFGDEKRPGMMGGMFEGIPFDNLPGGHGAVGAVIKVSTSTIVVAEPNNIEKIVLLNDQTIIRKARDEVKIKDIVIGDFVSIIGEANSKGEIEAKLVRIMPPPPFVSSIPKK
jgi:hypothetical protein